MIRDARVLGNLSGVSFRPPASEDEVRQCESKIGMSLPSEVAELIREANGGEGWVGDSYLILYGLGTIAKIASDATFRETLPGVFVFGGDGGLSSYGLCDQGVKVMYGSMLPEDSCLLAGSLREFLALPNIGELTTRSMNEGQDT